MDYCYLLLLFSISYSLMFSTGQHEDIPYENVEDICKTCLCLTARDNGKRYHHVLSCTDKRFQHILAHWPEEFGKNHDNVDIVATFSDNTIELLQQLPSTNATLTFSCRHCGIKYLQAPTFMDVPNIRRLDLSWNEITSEVLTSEVFRGLYRVTDYEPIALGELNLSHNKLHALNRKLFQHTPYLTKLNLRYNDLNVLNISTQLALSSLTNLQELDLSHTAIKTLTGKMLKSLVNLRVLNLSGNKLTTVPDKLNLVGRNLVSFNLAQNPIENFPAESFMGLQSLERLNISYMPELKSIDKNAFMSLRALRRLDCSHNSNLSEFDMESLIHSYNLTNLDLSHCALKTLSLTIDVTNVLSGNLTAATKPWPHLHSFDIFDNPWFCDCDFLQTIEYINISSIEKDAQARCDTPYLLSGARIFNLTSEHICNLNIPQKYKAIAAEERPRFLRKRYIILTVISVAVVVSIGVILGLVIAAIRRRLKSDDFGVEPIRYTSVRSSNLSAFSHGITNSVVVNDNGVANGINNA